jgi:hypothetical protein
MNNNHLELSFEDLETVTGGCDHGTGNCKAGSGQGDGLGQLRQLEGALVDAGKAIVAGIVGMF